MQAGMLLDSLMEALKSRSMRIKRGQEKQNEYTLGLAKGLGP